MSWPRLHILFKGISGDYTKYLITFLFFSSSCIWATMSICSTDMTLSLDSARNMFSKYRVSRDMLKEGLEDTMSLKFSNQQVWNFLLFFLYCVRHCEQNERKELTFCKRWCCALSSGWNSNLVFNWFRKSRRNVLSPPFFNLKCISFTHKNRKS